MKKQIKKELAVLLAVCFVLSLTVITVSAQPKEPTHPGWVFYPK
jgi:hypothetical protein